MSRATEQSHVAVKLLCKAVVEGALEQVKQILAKGVDVNSTTHDLKTALHHAAAEGQIEVVR